MIIWNHYLLLMAAIRDSLTSWGTGSLSSFMPWFTTVWTYPKRWLVGWEGDFSHQRWKGWKGAVWDATILVVDGILFGKKRTRRHWHWFLKKVVVWRVVVFGSRSWSSDVFHDIYAAWFLWSHFQLQESVEEWLPRSFFKQPWKFAKFFIPFR